MVCLLGGNMSKITLEDLKEIAKQEVNICINKKIIKCMDESLTDDEDNLYTIAMSVSDYIEDYDHTEDIYEFLIEEYPKYMKKNSPE